MATKGLGSLTIDLILKTFGFDVAADKVDKRLKKTSSSAKLAQNAMRNLGFAVGAVFSVQTLKSIVDVGLQFERIERSLKVTTGSAEAAAREFAFVTQVSNDLGLSLTATSTAYSKLAAAARGTALEGEATRDIFKSISQASVVLGLTADQTGGALTAIEQIISKGVVSMEELRQQLGERVPGALRAMASGLGVTVLELDEMIRKGELLAEDGIPGLVKGLDELYEAGAQDSKNSPQAAFTKLNNAILELKNTVATSGLLDFFADAANATAALIGPTDEYDKTLGELAQAYDNLAAAEDSFLYSGGYADRIREQVKELENKLEALRAINKAESGSQRDVGTRNAAVDSVIESFSILDETFIRNADNYAKALESFTSQFETAEDKANQLREQMIKFQEDLTPQQLEGANSLVDEILFGGIDEIETKFDDLLKKEGDFHGKRLELLAETRAKELEGVVQFLKSREDIEAEAYQRRAEIIIQNVDAGDQRNQLLLENAQQFANQLVDIEQDKQDRINSIVEAGQQTRAQFEQASAKSQAKSILGSLQTITAGVATHDKRMFAINKVASIANAVINTSEGITKALAAAPPPFNLALAAITAAAGAAQISAIQSTSFGSGTTPSVVGSTPTIAGQPVNNPNPAGGQVGGGSRSIEIRVMGNGILLQDQLKDVLRDAFDSDEVIIHGNSRQAANIRGGR